MIDKGRLFSEPITPDVQNALINFRTLTQQEQEFIFKLRILTPENIDKLSQTLDSYLKEQEQE